MATVTKKRATKQTQVGGVPYGNKWVNKYSFETNAAGILVDSDQTTAVVVADKVRIGVLPRGLEIHDALAIVSDAFTASVTFKVGFEYVDGVDSTTVPQDDDYFFAALANTAQRTTANNLAVRPVKLPKDAYLILTCAGANNASIGILDLIVEGELKGAI
jgi:hypothetical protein